MKQEIMSTRPDYEKLLSRNPQSYYKFPHREVAEKRYPKKQIIGKMEDLDRYFSWLNKSALILSSSLLLGLVVAAIIKKK